MVKKTNWDFAQEARQYDWPPYDFPEKWGLLEKPFVKRILKNNLNGYQITHTDTDLKNSMYDFLAEKNGHSIALEITQCTSSLALEGKMAILSENNYFPEESLGYDWIITLYKTADISKNGRKKLVENLKKLEAHYSHEDEILYFKLRQNPLPEVKQLHREGFNYFLGKRSSGQSGSYKFTSLLDTVPLTLWEAFKIAHMESTKNDNVKKLTAATTNERHIVIPVTDFHPGDAWYGYDKPRGNQILDIQEINERLETDFFLPDHIDVVWLATLRNFDRQIGYRLTKIINQKTHVTLEFTQDLDLYDSLLMEREK